MEIGAEQQAQQATIDEERQVKAKEYARIRRRLSYVNMGIGAVGVCVLLFTNLAGWLRSALQPLNWEPVHGWFPWQVLLFFLIVMLVYELVTIPLGYYGGFVLSHRYGLSVMTLRAWIRDLFVGLVLELVLGSAMFEIIYLLLATQPLTWWLWVALVLLFFSVVLANLAPVLLFPLFYKFRPLPEGELTRRLLALAQRAHTRVRGKYTDEEIEVVLAHELGHHVHGDIWKLIISQSLLTLGGLYMVNVVFHWAVETQHLYLGLADPATIPLLLTLIGLFGLVVMPLNNGLSRAIEYQADEYALQATHMIEPFKSAMTRLANQNLADLEPSPVIEFLFYSHPSMGKRLRHANEFVRRENG